TGNGRRTLMVQPYGGQTTPRYSAEAGDSGVRPHGWRPPKEGTWGPRQRKDAQRADYHDPESWYAEAWLVEGCNRESRLDRRGFQGTALEDSMQFTVVVHEAEEGGYWAEVPALPGCFSQGETVDAALENSQRAIASHVEALREDG